MLLVPLLPIELSFFFVVLRFKFWFSGCDTTRFHNFFIVGIGPFFDGFSRFVSYHIIDTAIVTLLIAGQM